MCFLWPGVQYLFNFQSVCCAICVCSMYVSASGQSQTWAVEYAINQLSKLLVGYLESHICMCILGMSSGVHIQLYWAPFSSCSPKLIRSKGFSFLLLLKSWDFNFSALPCTSCDYISLGTQMARIGREKKQWKFPLCSWDCYSSCYRKGFPSVCRCPCHCCWLPWG